MSHTANDPHMRLSKRLLARILRRLRFLGKSIVGEFSQYELRRNLKAVGVGFECDGLVHFSYPDRTEIGDWVYLGCGGMFDGCGGLSIGSHSMFGPEVVVMTAMHNYRGAQLIPYDEKELLRPVRIGTGTWVGIPAIIMPGVTLGDGCIVGAGAVVAKSFAGGSIIAGNPGRQIGSRDMDTFHAQLAEGRVYLKHKRTEGLKKIEVRDQTAQS